MISPCIECIVNAFFLVLLLSFLLNSIRLAPLCEISPLAMLFVSVGVKIAIIHFLNPTCHAEYISNVSPFLNWFPLFFLSNYIRIFSAKHILHISGYLPAIPRSIFFITIRNNFMMCRRILRSSNNVQHTPQCRPQLNNTINFLTAGRHAFW